MQNKCCVNGCFLNNSSKAHAHQLIILHNFISLQAFTVYMENSMRFEISLRSKWPKWNLHRSQFHFAWPYVNTDYSNTYTWLLMIFGLETQKL